MIQVTYDTDVDRFTRLYGTMKEAIADIKEKEEIGWRAEEIKEVRN